MNENILNIDSPKNENSLTLFFEKQARQIKEGGLRVFVQKVRRGLMKIFYMLCAFPFVLLIILLRPFIKVRLGKLDMSRIGRIYCGDWYLSERLAGMHGKPYFDIFYFTTADNFICNRQWVKMWSRALRVFPLSKIAASVDAMQRKILGEKSQNIPMSQVVPRGGEPMDKYRHKLECILSNTEPNIRFTSKEEEQGQRALRDMGIPESKPFICFHARDRVYLDKMSPERSWDYHDFRDSRINHYIPSAEEMVRRGYYAIRMGALVEEKLNKDNRFIIDYATNGTRSDFLDIYLGAKCRFFICSQTGISIIPEVFKKPVVFCNLPAINLVSTFVHNALVIPKKLYLRKEQRFLTFKEIIQSEIGEFCLGSQFQELGIELVDNTPEEIAAVAVEMDERLKGQWQITDEDKYLQQKFWSFFGPKFQKSPNLYMGAVFLRENTALME